MALPSSQVTTEQLAQVGNNYNVDPATPRPADGLITQAVADESKEARAGQKRNREFAGKALKAIKKFRSGTKTLALNMRLKQLKEFVENSCPTILNDIYMFTDAWRLNGGVGVIDAAEDPTKQIALALYFESKDIAEMPGATQANGAELVAISNSFSVSRRSAFNAGKREFERITNIADIDGMIEELDRNPADVSQSPMALARASDLLQAMLNADDDENMDDEL